MDSTTVLQKNLYFCKIITHHHTMKENTNFTLKHWADEDKPREKMIANGKKSLTNAELIAILLGSGQPGQNVVELAKKVLQEANNNLTELAHLGINDLTKIHGIGEAKAVSIVSAMEIGYRMLNEHVDSKEIIIRSSTDIFQYLGPSLIDLPHEEFWAIYMNVRKRVVFKQRISSGGLTETPVDIRLIFRTALEKNAVSIAVAHNHPTGVFTPSRKDKDLTHGILKAGEVLHIPLVDHIIVGINEKGRPDYYSFFDSGTLV